MTQPPHGDEAFGPEGPDPGRPADGTPPSRTPSPEYPPAVDPFATGPQPPVAWAPIPSSPPPPGPPRVPPMSPGFPPRAYAPGAFEGPPGGEPAPRKRRGVLVASIALGLALLLCGGGGVGAWLFLNRVERGQGATAPETAVDEFLRAVYTEQDADQATKLVCRAARDKAEIGRKVDEVKAYAAKYRTTSFEWEDPKVDRKTADRATVSVKVTATTGDERVADQQLTFTVIENRGWWVCEVGGAA
jgi:hypothetical protein